MVGTPVEDTISVDYINDTQIDTGAAGAILEDASVLPRAS